MAPFVSGKPFGANHSSRPLRRRILVSTLSVATTAVLLFALPLAFAVRGLDRSQEYAELQSQATAVAALIPDNVVGASVRVPVPRSKSAQSEAGTTIGIYTPDGQLIGGQGPSHSPLAASAGSGWVQHGGESGQLAAAVAVPSDRSVVSVVRAAVSAGSVSSHTAGRWVAMLILALVVLGLAGLLAVGQARRAARPLERLTEAARALGDGMFVIDLPRSGIREADVAAEALQDTAERLGRVLERERAFSADASHQLRTPLTGLLLGLEAALSRPAADDSAALREALDRGRVLERTIEDLLTLRRDLSDLGSVDVALVVRELAKIWSQPLLDCGRELTVSTADHLPPVVASAPALRQIVDVLLDNALHHGSGTVTLKASELAETVVIEIQDEGPGLTGDPEAAFARGHRHRDGHGIGLALARRLAEADGGRLIVRRARPAPIFALLLPVADSIVVPAGAPSPVSHHARSDTRDHAAW